MSCPYCKGKDLVEKSHGAVCRGCGRTARFNRPARCGAERAGFNHNTDREATQYCALAPRHEGDHGADGVTWTRADTWQLSARGFRRLVRGALGRPRRLFWRRGLAGEGRRSIFVLAAVLRRWAFDEHREEHRPLVAHWPGPKVDYFRLLREALRAEGRGPRPCPGARRGDATCLIYERLESERAGGTVTPVAQSTCPVRLDSD